jgi:hypothetical protein
MLRSHRQKAYGALNENIIKDGVYYSAEEIRIFYQARACWQKEDYADIQHYLTNHPTLDLSDAQVIKLMKLASPKETDNNGN